MHISQKSSTFAENYSVMTDESWHWQEPETAWRGIGIYHVTLVVSSRDPLLGTLIIPENDPSKAYVERKDLGKEIVYIIGSIQNYRPEIRLLQYCLMPDHVHFIIHVQRPMPYSIKSVVRGFWQAAKKVGREYNNILSINPNDIRDNKQNRDNEQRLDPIFSDYPFIRPMSRRGQLDAMMQYIKLNPQRLATKRLMPDYFRVQEGIEIAGRTYAGVGNADLLQRAKYMPVHVRSTMVDEAEHGDNTRLRNYMNSCVLAARQGTVMVSPFISKQEQAIMAVLLKEGLPFIYIADNGFRDFYKPQDSLFDAVAEKQVLILSPWDYDPHKKHVSRAECVEMNKMAEEICHT